MAPLLSICIATYNRANYIGETLESIIPQLDDDVEILVVDGASTDNTEAIVHEFTQKEPRVRFIRLPVKGGVDHDYDKSIEHACGEFCWLFTDDDIVKPGAIVAVKEAIEKGYDLVVVNAEVRDRELSTILSSRRVNIYEDKVYAPNQMEKLFIDALHYLSFIGAVVIRRNIWLNRERSFYFGTEFVHVGVIFQKSLPGAALIIAEPYIVIRLGNGQWTPRSFDIWMFKWPRLVWSFNHISDKAKMKVIPKEPWKNFKKLIAHRSDGSYDIACFKKYFLNLHVNYLWKFCAWLIAWFPRIFIIGCHYFYCRIKNPEALADFKNSFAQPGRK